MEKLDLTTNPHSSYRDDMFDIYCPSHQARVLLGPRAIEALENTPDGIVLHWRCRCGARGTELTGRTTSRAAA
jgi:hypothetical protein